MADIPKIIRIPVVSNKVVLEEWDAWLVKCAHDIGVERDEIENEYMFYGDNVSVFHFFWHDETLYRAISGKYNTGQIFGVVYSKSSKIRPSFLCACLNDELVVYSEPSGRLALTCKKCGNSDSVGWLA